MRREGWCLEVLEKRIWKRKGLGNEGCVGREWVGCKENWDVKRLFVGGREYELYGIRQRN